MGVSGTPRVLQVVLGLDPGGTERLVIELVKRLTPHIPMAVCCLDTAGAWAEELTEQGIRVAALGRGSGFRPALGRAVAVHARAHRATLLHCHHYSPFVYGCLARLWRPNTRIVFTEHGRLSDAPPSPKRRLANRMLSRIPDAVLTVSGDLRRHLLAEGFPPRRVEVIYNGIDVGPPPTAALRCLVRQELGVMDGTLVVGTIARLDPVKDLGVVIAGIAEIAGAIPVHAVIIGDGPERTRLEALAAATGVARHMTFLGHRGDARRWLAGCDVFVNTSISEGVSLTILEAMAAGLPVIATAVGGTPEIVDTGCGLPIPARSPQALSEALRTLAARPDLRSQLGAAARARVEARFTLDRMVREYHDVYRSVSPIF